MPLSVASALARQGTDPWMEAERLAKLPREIATQALAAMIVRTFPARMKPSDAPGIAARLILLLPTGAESPSVPQEGPPVGRYSKLALLICLAFIVFASLNLLADRRPASEAPPTAGMTSTP